MKFIMILIIFIASLSLFAQTREELLQDFMQQREQMMKQMMDLFNESFEDDFFDTKDPFGQIESFKGQGSNVSIEETYEKDGSISILIKPQNPNVSLDIKTSEQRITISSQIKQETTTYEAGNTYKSMSMSSFSRSIGIPQGYTAKSPEAIDGGVKISLVPSDRVKPLSNKDKAKPLLKQDPDMI